MASMPINDRRLIKLVMLISFCSAKFQVNKRKIRHFQYRHTSTGPGEQEEDSSFPIQTHKPRSRRTRGRFVISNTDRPAEGPGEQEEDLPFPIQTHKPRSRWTRGKFLISNTDTPAQVQVNKRQIRKFPNTDTLGRFVISNTDTQAQVQVNTRKIRHF